MSKPINISVQELATLIQEEVERALNEGYYDDPANRSGFYAQVPAKRSSDPALGGGRENLAPVMSPEFIQKAGDAIAKFLNKSPYKFNRKDKLGALQIALSNLDKEYE